MNLKDKIKKLFIERYPNTLMEIHILNEFEKHPPSEIRANLEQLIKEDFLSVRADPVRRRNNPSEIVLERKSYYITKEVNVPIETEINVGGVNIPRMLDGDVARGEDINATALRFNRVFSKMSEDFRRELKHETTKFWGTLVATFGLFLSIFSLLNLSIKLVPYSRDMALKEVLLQSIVNILPLTVVLSVFTIVLYVIFRR